MKLLIALFAVAFASVSQADVLPSNVRTAMILQISQECNVSNLVELSTQVVDQEYDQGKTDRYFTTEFSAKVLFDGVHPVDVRLTATAVTDLSGQREVEYVGRVKADVAGACQQ